MDISRCRWAKGELMIRYHDEEWGRPAEDDQKLYEMLLLEAFQAGLSWQVVLSKRENFRRAFDGFDAHKIAAYDESKIAQLLSDPGLIRCRRKIEGAVVNARIFLEIQREFGSFRDYLYSFTGGEIITNESGEVITTSPVSDALSRDLRKRGMKYMGSVTVYSYLQAVGVVNDHEPQCFRKALR
ncbi:MAG: DNA-3-methyladenine glycosylase I [Clostridia bacterium]|nr:DNA-3-methyladenine glycosylase I [Clostridia bacterium]